MEIWLFIVKSYKLTSPTSPADICGPPHSPKQTHAWRFAIIADVSVSEPVNLCLQVRLDIFVRLLKTEIIGLNLTE